MPKKGYKQAIEHIRKSAKARRSDLSDIVGRKFGRLHCVRYAYKEKRYYYYWCECKCGEWITVRRSSLLCNATKSCGCFLRERVSEANRGKTGKNHPSYGKKRPDASSR